MTGRDIKPPKSRAPLTVTVTVRHVVDAAGHSRLIAALQRMLKSTPTPEHGSKP